MIGALARQASAEEVVVVAARVWAAAMSMNTTTGIGMAAAGAAEAAGCMCEGFWSTFATDVGSFKESARGLSGSGGSFFDGGGCRSGTERLDWIGMENT
jgi:hypothetical protein